VRMASSPKKVSPQASGGERGLNIPGLLVTVIVCLGLRIASSKLATNELRASVKTFDNFESFYPFYLSQHADTTCQRLHFAGTSIIIALSLLSSRGFKYGISLFPALIMGCAACNMTKQYSHGIIEAVALLAVFVFSVKLNVSTWSQVFPAFGLITIGYAFAWVGHFYFEMNRPATFIYPTYSLMGDFKMWFEIATGARPF
jgi:hypothetical protein